MNYEELFNLSYSSRIPESLKETVLNNLELPISEEIEISEDVIPYIEVLNLLSFSNASEELTNSIIEEVFSGLSEEFIEEVYEGYIKVRVTDYLSEAYQYIGLSKMRSDWDKADKAEAVAKAQQAQKEQQAQQKKAQREQAINNAKEKIKNTFNSAKTKFGNAINTAKEKAQNAGEKVKSVWGSAKEKIKGAVNKVQNWAKDYSSKVDNYNKKYIDHDALRKAIGLKHIENQMKGKPDFEGGEKRSFSQPKTVSKPKVQTQPEESNKEEEVKAATPKKRPGRPKKTEVKTETPKKRPGRPKKTEVKTEINEPVQGKLNFDSGEKKGGKGNKKSLATQMATDSTAETPKKRPGRPRKNPVVSEALTETICLLINSNISENSFVEIMELLAATPNNINKAQERRDSNYEDALDKLNSEVINKNISQETLNKAEDAGAKKRRLDDLVKNHEIFKLLKHRNNK